MASFTIQILNMKKIFLLAMLTVLGVTTSNAQETKKAKVPADAKTAAPKVEGAGMVFETETIDYGTIEHNAEGTRKFVFTNNGNKPLIITNTQGSCGCTVPQWPKDPIAPGATGQIVVKFNSANKVGKNSKKVTIVANTEPISTVLTITAEVKSK